MKITIGHLYPDLLNLYGDRGNIQCLMKRCQWRGIEAETIAFEFNDKIDFVDGVSFFAINRYAVAPKNRNKPYPESPRQSPKKIIKNGAKNGVKSSSLYFGSIYNLQIGSNQAKNPLLFNRIGTLSPGTGSVIS